MRRPSFLHILLGLTAALLPMAIACSGDDDEGGTGAAPAAAATAPPVTGGGVAPQEAAKVSPATAIEGIDHALKQQVDMSLTVTSPVFHATRRIPKKPSDLSTPCPDYIATMTLPLPVPAMSLTRSFSYSASCIRLGSIATTAGNRRA